MKVFGLARRGAVVAVVVLLAGCGDTRDADPGSAPATTEIADTPSVEPTGPETPVTTREGGGGVSVSLPSLPIGGQSEPDRGKRQCVPVNWLEPGDKPNIPKGISVAVTSVRLTPAGLFDKGASGCGGAPRCDSSFVFTSQRLACSVSVTAKGTGETARLSVSGAVNCPAGQAQKCRDLVARVSPGSIEVVQPDPPEEQPPTTPSG
jgi:hypothetical protein